MSIIDESYFIADLGLPKGNKSNLSLFIPKFEKEILMKLLGSELYFLMISNTTVEPYKSLVEGADYTVSYNGKDRTVKWMGLKNDAKNSIIAYYVYIEFLRRTVTLSTQVGERRNKAENSDSANVFGKILSAQTELEELYGYEGQHILAPSAYNFLYNNKEKYPEWIFESILGNINSHDL